MDEFHLAENYRKALKVSFRTTFYSFVFLFLAVMFVELSRAAELFVLGRELAEYMVYFFASVFIACVATMLSYPMIYLHYLWRRGERKKVALGILVIGCLSFFSGYIWYYQREVKQQEIKIKLLDLHDFIAIIRK